MSWLIFLFSFLAFFLLKMLHELIARRSTSGNVLGQKSQQMSSSFFGIFCLNVSLKDSFHWHIYWGTLGKLFFLKVRTDRTIQMNLLKTDIVKKGHGLKILKSDCILRQKGTLWLAYPRNLGGGRGRLIRASLSQKLMDPPLATSAPFVLLKDLYEPFLLMFL